MIARVLRFVLHQRFVAMALSMMLIVLGVWAFQQLKVEAYPDISDPQVVVITQYAGRAAEEVEQQVTIPIERALNNTPQVIARRSRTIFGLSVVELTFSYDTNDYFARQVVLERLRQADLPDGVTPDLGPMATPIGELYRFTVNGPGRTPLELRDLEDWVITPRLLQVSGVADVTPFGGLVKQFQIEVKPLALDKYGLSIAQVQQAVTANNRNVGAGQLDTGQQSMVVRGIGLARTAEDIGNIVVATQGSVPIFVHDLGTVAIGGAPQTGIFGRDERSGLVEGIVLMRRGENPSEVLKHIKSAVLELNSGLLPEGVKIEPIYDRTDLVNNTFETVQHTLIEGMVIVIGMLLLFLGNLRAALLTALTIPLSMLFAFVCMHLLGIPANLLSLGALDFGVVVDGTLVMVEHIVRSLEHHRRPGDSVIDTIRIAALEVESPIFFSLAIIICAYIPLFTLERVERRLFTPMAFTVCLALLGSMILALTLIPVLATYFFRNGVKTWENPLLTWILRNYERTLKFTLSRPGATALAGLGVVSLSVGLAASLGSEFLPQLDEGTLWVRANLYPGVSLQESAKIASEIRRIIGAHSGEVDLVSSQTGRNDSGTDPYGPNRNEFFVRLKPYDTWQLSGGKAALVTELSKELNAKIPGAAFSFTQPIIDNVTEAVTGSPADLAVIFRGPDLGVLRMLTGRTLEILRQVPGAADTFLEQETEQAQARITIDRQAVARYGMNVSDVENVIETAVGGKASGSVFQSERRYDITIRYPRENRTSLSQIGAITLRTPDGLRVPLSNVAKIETANGASILVRRDNQRVLSVRTNIRGRDQGGFVAEAQAAFAKSIALPKGYEVIWGGQFENLERARKRLQIILPLTIALIFAILFFAFNSASNAGLVLANVPFSLAGGLFFLYMRGINLSVSAAVGFISLFGVAVMSGLLYLAEIERRRTQSSMPLEEAVITGATAQLRPRLILILVAMLGMVPAARAVGIGSDIQRPLATVVVGGLLSTLVLTLLVLPSLYYLIARRKENQK